jgi:hypothetical protein
MQRANSNLFRPDLVVFKKRLIIKYVLLLIFNASILLGTYISNAMGNTNYLIFCLFLISAFIFLFTNNYRRQMEFIQAMVLEFSSSNLLLHGTGGACEELNLKEIESIKIDRIFGVNRVFLKGKDNRIRTYADIEDQNDFVKLLEEKSGLKTERIERRPILLFSKTIIIYLPSIITLITTLIPESKVGMNVFFLILNLNTIFMIHNISESKLEGGIQSNVARRVILLLLLLFFFQFYIVFNGY